MIEKNYPVKVVFDEQFECFFSYILDIEHSIIKGSSIEEVLKKSEKTLKITIKILKMDNKPIPEPSNQEGENIHYIKGFIPN